LQKREPHSRTHNKTEGQARAKSSFYHAIRYTITVQYTYIIQACYDPSINTLRLDSTHPDYI